MYVRIWDGSKVAVKDRDEAVALIKKELRGWMNSDDHIGWYNSDEDDRLGRKPSHALVMTDYGEATDAEAWIVYTDLPAQPAPKGRSSLTVPEEHQLKIARQTLKMPDAMAGVMGGMTKKQAKKVVARLSR
jgi:hypothetical protein